MNKKAFTLAELLISMAIVGIISVLMIPVMMNSQLKVLETQTAQFYSMMSNAIAQYMADNDTKDLTSTPMSMDSYSSGRYSYSTRQQMAVRGVDDFVHKYFKVKKICTNLTQGVENECFPETIHNLNDESASLRYIAFYPSDLKAYVLNNGAVFTMSYINGIDGSYVQVDINGKKGPNVVGRDIWQMMVYSDGIVSERLHLVDLNYSSSSASTIVTYKKYLLDRMNELCNGTAKINDNSATYYYVWVNTYSNWQYGGGCFAQFEVNNFKFENK